MTSEVLSVTLSSLSLINSSRVLVVGGPLSDSAKKVFQSLVFSTAHSQGALSWDPTEGFETILQSILARREWVRHLSTPLVPPQPRSSRTSVPVASHYAAA